MSNPKQNATNNAVVGITNEVATAELLSFFQELSPTEVAENQESLDLFISLLSETEYFDDVVLRKEANRVKRFFAGFAKLHKTIVGQEVRCV